MADRFMIYSRKPARKQSGHLQAGWQAVYVQQPHSTQSAMVASVSRQSAATGLPFIGELRGEHQASNRKLRYGQIAAHYKDRTEAQCCVSRLCAFGLSLILSLFFAIPWAAANPIQEGEMAGYLLVPNDRVPETYNAGFSMYVTAWPLLKAYPGDRFQTGLFGTWMFAQYDGPKPENMYSCIEGGLGWWRDTRFATETPKFIMGGVALNFSAWANGPGAGKGRDWDHPQGKYGVAQLSPWVLWPPDGLNLQQGTCGELFGYGYLSLPLTQAKARTAGKDVPTGNNCWTLFLNTGNFKGPVAFFTPYFFSRPSVDDSRLAGMFLDSRPSDPNRALQMETQYIPAVLSADNNDNIFARIAPTIFPGGPEGYSTLAHRVTSYSRVALWDAVNEWFEGGSPADGVIDPQGAVTHRFPGHGGSTWKIYKPSESNEEKVSIAWDSFASPMAVDPETYGYKWNDSLVMMQDADNVPTALLPEYYRQVKEDDKKPKWVAIPSEDVPAETGLAGVQFKRSDAAPAEPYVTPESPNSCWKQPGPVAGPFQAYPGDGSVVTYYWYRFADQPALLNADLTDQDREDLQKRVEKIHRLWTRDREYLAAPKRGKLANIDPALIVSPPPGFEAALCVYTHETSLTYGFTLYPKESTHTEKR